MPKRRSGERGGGRAAKRSRRRHLYLVLDDWWWGYSIRKVNLSSSGSDSDDSTEPLQPQAFPPEHPVPPAIIAVLSMRSGFEYRPSAPSTSVPVFDLRRRGFMLGPRPEVDLVLPIFIPVGGGRIFALSADSFQMHPFSMNAVTVERLSVSSYAVHPDGRTIFVSTESGGTFTFDTAAEHLGWTEHGRWALPFAGRAHFDPTFVPRVPMTYRLGLLRSTRGLDPILKTQPRPSLDDWVGLFGDKNTKGHPVRLRGGLLRRPGWKVGKEKLFSEDPAEKHVGATLVSMGGRSQFCLVECVSRVAAPYVCRLTTFSLRFGEDGLPTVGDSRRVRCYKVPESINGFTLSEPVAFWM
uniref:Uncharacterized protein n=1 Tax=Setaria italica TaxID=4555 RepID=K4AK21_SETIT